MILFRSAKTICTVRNKINDLLTGHSVSPKCIFRNHGPNRSNSFQPITFKLIAAFLLASMSCSVVADDQPANRWFSISFDNDIFVGTDGGYTNGLYASWFYLPENPQSTDDLPWYFWLQSKLTNTTNNARQVQIHNISQTMVTPSDIDLVPPDPNDSPYAGLLFWQGGLLSVENRTTDFSSVLIGMLGPASLAEQSQKIVHKVTGSDIPQGWNFQLGNEAVIGFNYGRYRRLFNGRWGNIEFDTVAGINGFVGNLLTAVESVGYLRVGTELEISYPMFALTSNREINPTATSGGYFVYVGFGALYSFQDLLFNRHSIRESNTISSDNLADSLSIGAAVSGQKWGFSINFTESGLFGDREAGPQKFGSFTFLRKLN